MARKKKKKIINEHLFLKGVTDGNFKNVGRL